MASDIRLKENISDNVVGTELINNLRPVHFKWKNCKDYKQGFIAQEVEATLEKLNIDDEKNTVVCTSEKTDIKTIDELQLIPSLVKAFQEQSAMIEGQSKRIDSLEKKIVQLSSNQ